VSNPTKIIEFHLIRRDRLARKTYSHLLVEITVNVESTAKFIYWLSNRKP